MYRVAILSKFDFAKLFAVLSRSRLCSQGHAAVCAQESSLSEGFEREREIAK